MHRRAAGAFDSPDDYYRNDAYKNVSRLASMTVRVDCGTGDPFYASVRKFVANVPIKPQGTFGHGFHDAAYWRSIALAQIKTISTAPTSR
jgi:hypothetical protein